RFLSVARLSFSPIPIASGASATSTAPGCEPARASAARSAASGPTRHTTTPRRLAAGAPSTTTRAPRSRPAAPAAARGPTPRHRAAPLRPGFLPPRDGLALAVPAARADAVRELRLVAVRADAETRSLQVVVPPSSGGPGFRVAALGIGHPLTPSSCRTVCAAG